MVQPVVPNQDIPLISSQKVLSRPQLGHVLPHDIGYCGIFVHLLQVGEDSGWALSQSQEVFSCLQALVLAPNTDFQVSPQGASFV